MIDTMPNDSLFVPTYIARQPIFDIKKNIWGYELLYRHASDATAAIFSDEESATLAVAACASCQQMHFSRNSKLLINFSEKSILEKIPHALPATDTVVEIPAHPSDLPGYLESLQYLKREGYRIALDSYEGHPGSELLLEVADILKIDMPGKTGNDVSRILETTRGKEYLLIAKRIEEHEQFQMAKNLDFTLFQGYFFHKPVVLEGRKLTANQASRLQLFSIMERDEPDFDRLTNAIQADVAISYSLLSYLNSPAIGLREPIKSIKQALLLLGWKQIKNWLRVVILRDMAHRDTPSELPYTAVQRGKFFQLAASNQGKSPFSPDSLFLLGLFSLLEPMLSLPIRSIVENLPLEPGLKKALCGEQTPYSGWLNLAQAFETANWDDVDSLVEELHLDPLHTAQSYYESIAWASVFFQQPPRDV